MARQSHQGGQGRCHVIANLKGGVGKSTVSSFLSAYLEGKGHQVAVLDLDKGQGDTERFARLRGRGLKVLEGTDDPARLYDRVNELLGNGWEVVVDTPPGESRAAKLACYMASAVIMPVRPGTNDVAAIGRLMEMASLIRQERSDLQVLTLCNFYKGSKEANLMVELLKSMSNATFVGRIADRKDYSSALAEGKAPWELVPGKPAAEEMEGICAALDRMVVG
jgi:chromosome partitioning protein